MLHIAFILVDSSSGHSEEESPPETTSLFQVATAALDGLFITSPWSGHSEINQPITEHHSRYIAVPKVKLHYYPKGPICGRYSIPTHSPMSSATAHSSTAAVTDWSKLLSFLRWAWALNQSDWRIDGSEENVFSLSAASPTLKTLRFDLGGWEPSLSSKLPRKLSVSYFRFRVDRWNLRLQRVCAQTVILHFMPNALALWPSVVGSRRCWVQPNQWGIDLKKMDKIMANEQRRYM